MYRNVRCLEGDTFVRPELILDNSIGSDINGRARSATRDGGLGRSHGVKSVDCDTRTPSYAIEDR